MAITLIATPSATNANTYCTLAEANTYHESRNFVDNWTAASDDEKNRALANATRLLDHWYSWRGYPTTTTQALQWPRNGVLDHLQWSYIVSTVIPSGLKEATAEFARQLIEGDRTAQLAQVDQGLSSLTAGPISLSFTGEGGATAPVVPDAVSSLIYPWWGQLRGSSLVKAVGR